MKLENVSSPLAGPGRASRWALIAGACAALVTIGRTAATYPNEFRAWTHVKSALITQTHPAAESEGGLHHIYANPKAVEGYRTGKFPEGSAIAYELLETNEKDGLISEGKRRRLDVMIRDSARYQTTGGWGYQRFMGTNDTSLDDGSATQCHECHSRAREHGFVFSRIR